ncbi:MAG: hypothetical protein GF315_05345 [candidate division Zixibacteria bacterium]|nr:hypothetical protein [candidate division Zixibacteria bacterium]
MTIIPARLNIEKDDIPKAIYAFAFIGIHFGIKFEFATDNPLLIYGSFPSDEDRSARIMIPVDAMLIDGGNKPTWNKISSLVILSGSRFRGSRLYREEENAIVFNFDIIGSIFYLLSRSEEYYSQARDEHNRFPHTESILYESDCLAHPVVDHYLRLLRKLFAQLGIECENDQKPTAILSHDVDLPIRSIKGSAKLLLVSNNSISSRFKGMYDALKSVSNFERNPFWNFRKYCQAESGFDMKSSFNFVCPRNRSRFDPKYEIGNQNLRNEMVRLKENQFEIGLHGSYNSLLGDADIEVEKRYLEKNSGIEVQGHRAHYLRFDVASSYHKLIKAGFLYDSSIGYSETIGYRAGTGIPFRAFDIQKNRTLRLIEIPFAVMDGPLFAEFSTIEAVREKLDSLIEETSNVHGMIGFLWHLRTAYSVDYPAWFDCYEYLLRRLNEKDFRVITPLMLAQEFEEKTADLGYDQILF